MNINQLSKKAIKLCDMVHKNHTKNGLFRAIQQTNFKKLQEYIDTKWKEDTLSSTKYIMEHLTLQELNNLIELDTNKWNTLENYYKEVINL